MAASDEPRQDARGRVARDAFVEPREHRCDGVRADRRDDEQRQSHDRESKRVGRGLAAETTLRAGTRQLWQQNDAQRRRGEPEHDEDAVGGKEAVGLRAAPELVRDDDADDRSEPLLDGQCEGGDGAAAERAVTVLRGRALRGHRRESVRGRPGRAVLVCKVGYSRPAKRTPPPGGEA